jgi:hypothetical protein
VNVNESFGTSVMNGLITHPSPNGTSRDSVMDSH